MLESEIKRLTDTIERLIEVMEGETPKPETPETETPQEDHPKIYTHKDVKDMALVICKKDRSYKDKIKAKLAEHDANVATDLSDDATQIVGDWLQNLKDEIGA